MPSCGVFHNGTGVLSINFFSSLELYYLNPGYKEQFWLCIYLIFFQKIGLRADGTFCLKELDSKVRKGIFGGGGGGQVKAAIAQKER